MMSDVVKQYYDENSEYEWERLNRPYSMIEFQSTMYLIEKYFPKVGAICDIGAGPGRYSVELLQRGYRVTLVELSANELELARAKISELGLVAEDLICEDARNLQCLPDDAYDAILLMGPMYHLLDRGERMEVLQNVKRILKPEGVAIVAYLNSWGILKAGVTEFFESYADINQIYQLLGELHLDAETGFTEAYFSTPVLALQEVVEAGLAVVSYAGAEGFLAGLEHEMAQHNRENRPIYDNLLKVAAETCEYPQYRDATEHLHIVVKKSHSSLAES